MTIRPSGAGEGRQQVPVPAAKPACPQTLVSPGHVKKTHDPVGSRVGNSVDVFSGQNRPPLPALAAGRGTPQGTEEGGVRAILNAAANSAGAGEHSVPNTIKTQSGSGKAHHCPQSNDCAHVAWASPWSHFIKGCHGWGDPPPPPAEPCPGLGLRHRAVEKAQRPPHFYS